MPECANAHSFYLLLLLVNFYHQGLPWITTRLPDDITRRL